MRLRTRLVLTQLVVVVAVIIGIGTTLYSMTRSQLQRELDRSLDGATMLVTGDLDQDIRDSVATSEPDIEHIVLQYLGPDGSVSVRSPGRPLPVDDADRRVAARIDASTPDRGVELDGDSYRLRTVPLPGGGAVQIAQSLAASHRALREIRNRTMGIAASGALVAIAAGYIVGRRLTRRLEALAAAARDANERGLLDVELPGRTHDEVTDLAAALRHSLAAAESLRASQRRLIQDAGHELRTPITSLRTNVEILKRHPSLSAEERAQVVGELHIELAELTALVAEVVGLANADATVDEPSRVVSIAEIARRAVEDAARRGGQVSLRVDGEIEVTGQQRQLRRAIDNLIDNALKFGGGTPVDVRVVGARIEVLDRGPGIDPAEAALVFDRFYRTIEGRSHPGSGLGLAIVRETILRHHGDVFVCQRPDGGTCAGFELPRCPAVDA